MISPRIEKIYSMLTFDISDGSDGNGVGTVFTIIHVIIYGTYVMNTFLFLPIVFADVRTIFVDVRTFKNCIT
jgi:hypothetical protein